ncbi:MAG: MBL fold metallo-hydrolase [Gemmatimonadota bacterium]
MPDERADGASRRRGPDLVVLRANNPGPMTLDGTRSYVLGNRRVAIVDPGPDDAAALDALERAVAGRDVAALLLTHAHADHAGGAARAAERFGVPVSASAATLDRLGLDGRDLADGATLEVESGRTVTALHAPGHSADHVCYLSEPGRRLFTGDLVLGEGSSAILHPDGRVADCLASLARLIALRPRSLLPGHGDPVGPPAEAAERKLAEYRRHRLDRERQIVAALEGGAAGVPEIRHAVYGRLPAGLARAADASVAAHLAALSARGLSVPPFEDFGATEE